MYVIYVVCKDMAVNFIHIAALLGTDILVSIILSVGVGLYPFIGLYASTLKLLN
jgi:hypothetical protein